MDQARFALVEAFGVEGFLETQQLEVQMMAEFMDQSTNLEKP